jgi:hypothetical protein
MKIFGWGLRAPTAPCKAGALQVSLTRIHFAQIKEFAKTAVHRMAKPRKVL